MKNLSLNAKFIFVLSIFVVASIVISTLGIQKLQQLNGQLENIVTVTAPRVFYAKEMDSLLNHIRNQEKVFVLEENHEAMKKVDDLLKKGEEDFVKNVEALGSISSDIGKADLAQVMGFWKEWRPVTDELRSLALAGKDAEASALARGKSRDLLASIGEVLTKLSTRNEESLKADEEKADQLYETSKNLMLAVSISAVIIGLFLAFVILRAVNKAIDKVITDLNDSSAQVTSAAGQIASSSEELSQAATEQAASLEETSSAVEELNSMVKKNSETAKQSTEVSTVSSDSASKGKRVVEEMIRSIEDIDAANTDIMKQTNESNQKISEIVKVIGEIGNKTKVINEIVFQTKLLSFNASVEAARAGEHGKGFAVVAEEVGNLAQMSGNAAKEITTMLDSSIQKVETIVHETKTGIEKLIADSKAKVESGTKVAKSCGEVLDEIVTNVTNVAQMSQSISSASDEQSRGVAEITKAITQLDHVTQQNAAASEETASAAEELSAQSDNMRGVVEMLIQTIKGAKGNQEKVSHRSETAPHTTKSKVAKESGGRVLQLKSKKSLRSKANATVTESEIENAKITVGSDVIPSENDPRFKEL